ncbi:MAG: hypothetical protein LBE83_02090 [Propionibacteriaceae bacterium]|jgi:hypothetical protein|nr:hypothetical protein [Propionibacteriaceae bacterium]
MGLIIAVLIAGIIIFFTFAIVTPTGKSDLVGLAELGFVGEDVPAEPHSREADFAGVKGTARMARSVVVYCWKG